MFFVVWFMVYVVVFFGFYFVMMLVLFVLFFRLFGFDYCLKIDLLCWCNNWDWGLFVGSFILVLVFGVVFGNLL